MPLADLLKNEVWERAKLFMDGAFTSNVQNPSMRRNNDDEEQQFTNADRLHRVGCKRRPSRDAIRNPLGLTNGPQE
jgi:hypothetical protein